MNSPKWRILRHFGFLATDAIPSGKVVGIDRISSHKPNYYICSRKSVKINSQVHFLSKSLFLSHFINEIGAWLSNNMHN